MNYATQTQAEEARGKWTLKETTVVVSLARLVAHCLACIWFKSRPSPLGYAQLGPHSM